MNIKYVVYTKNAGNKLFETEDIQEAFEFVDAAEANDAKGDYHNKYEIVKVVR